MLFVWGMAGAFIYATNTLILRLWNEGGTESSRQKALAEWALALVTGGLFSLALTEGLQGLIRAGVEINGFKVRADLNIVPVALTTGWAANYLWPKILRKFGEAVERSAATKVVDE
jgi:hypothetical protein